LLVLALVVLTIAGCGGSGGAHPTAAAEPSAPDKVERLILRQLQQRAAVNTALRPDAAVAVQSVTCARRTATVLDCDASVEAVASAGVKVAGSVAISATCDRRACVWHATAASPDTLLSVLAARSVAGAAGPTTRTRRAGGALTRALLSSAGYTVADSDVPGRPAAEDAFRVPLAGRVQVNVYVYGSSAAAAEAAGTLVPSLKKQQLQVSYRLVGPHLYVGFARRPARLPETLLDRLVATGEATGTSWESPAQKKADRTRYYALEKTLGRTLDSLIARSGRPVAIAAIAPLIYRSFDSLGPSGKQQFATTTAAFLMVEGDRHPEVRAACDQIAGELVVLPTDVVNAADWRLVSE